MSALIDLKPVNVVAAMTRSANVLDEYHPDHKSPAARELDDARDLVIAMQSYIKSVRCTLQFNAERMRRKDMSAAELEGMAERADVLLSKTGEGA